MPEVIATALITACVAIIGSAASLVVARLDAKKNAAKIDELKKALDDSGGVFYINCPNCGAKIYLRGVEIYKE